MNRFFLIFKWLAAGVAILFCTSFVGCSSIDTIRTAGTPSDLVRGHSYEPQNVFAGAGALPVNIRRVEVLPLACDQNNSALAEGRAELQPILLDELIKTKRFEVVSSDSDFLKNRTDRAEWGSEDTLPPEFFTSLRDNSGCDAVLFTRLTVFRAYPPLAVGWRMRLVDAQTRRTIWAADEVFDGGQPAVENGARRHQLNEERDPSGAPDEWYVQNSPAKFGEYTAARLLATLPPR